MALTLTGKELARIKRAFAKIISAKTAHTSALAGILFTPGEDKAILRATNLEETLDFTIDGTVEHPNLLAFEDLKALASRVQANGEVIIRFKAREMAFEICNPKALPFAYSTATEDPGEFPETPVFEPEETVAYEGNDFAVALKRVIPAASTDATRYILNSVFYNGADQELVATDGRRLVLAGLPGRNGTRSAIIPATKTLRKGLPSDENLILELGEQHARLSADDWTYTVKLVDGNYPNYKQVIPDDALLSVTIQLCDDRKANADVVKALPKSETVTLYADSERVLLVTPNGDDFVHAQLPHARSNGDDPITVAVNPKFLLDAFSAGFNRIRLLDEFKPVKISNGEGGFTVVMPLRGGAGKSALAYLQKVTAHAPTSVTKPVELARSSAAPKPKNNKPKDPIPMDANEKHNQVDDRDPLDILLERTTAIREDVRECFQNLREVQALAKDAIKERKAERKEVKAVEELKAKLQKLAA